MKPDLIARYEALRLPRYTSYPTAPHFSTAVDHLTYAEWLNQHPQGPLSVYIHVPFCGALCYYCGCHTTVAHRYDPIAAYVDILEIEIERVARQLSRKGEIRHLHWGGGTPSMLRSSDFRRIAALLESSFGLARDAEIAIELDPRTITPDGVEAWRSTGINRASLGVQTFDVKVQRAVGRVQSFSETSRAVDWLRRGGIDQTSFDLMYGLPYQTVANTIETVDAALTLDPDRVSLFGYAHVPWMKRHQALIPDQTLPGAAERLAQFEAAAVRLADAGYIRIGLDHFAKADDPLTKSLVAGKLRRNFQGYTTDSANLLIGFGASAISSLAQGYAQNAVTVSAYRAALLDGSLATARGVALTPDDRLRRDIIERLMCDFTVDIEEQCSRHHVDVSHLSPELDRVGVLLEDGIVRRSAYRIEVPEGAQSLIRVVAAVFDAKLGGVGRHAVAI